jgi:hypothetical protein
VPQQTEICQISKQYQLVPQQKLDEKLSKPKLAAK